MHEVLVNRLGGLSLPRKSVVRLIDRPDMTLDVYHGRKTTMQQQQHRVTLYQNCSNDVATLNKMAARAINRNKLLTTSSAKSMDRF